jgi:hypothetical protein
LRDHVQAPIQHVRDRQRAFVDEVRGWEGGVLPRRFATPEELEAAVTRALHDLELARQAAPLDELRVGGARGGPRARSSRLLRRVALRRGRRPSSPASHPTLRAGRSGAAPDLHREVLLGENAAFHTTEGVRIRIEGILLLPSTLGDKASSVRQPLLCALEQVAGGVFVHSPSGRVPLRACGG